MRYKVMKHSTYYTAYRQGWFLWTKVRDFRLARTGPEWISAWPTEEQAWEACQKDAEEQKKKRKDDKPGVVGYKEL